MARHIAPDPAVLRTVLEEEGSVKRAAERLGVSRRTLHRWIDRAGIVTKRPLITEEAA